MLTVDPEGIRSALDRMLRIGDCGKFVEDLINRLGASTKNPFVSDYALDLFDAVAGGKGGFIRGGLANKNRVSQKFEGWKGLVPLRSTRADVERLLGPSVRPCKEGCTDDTKSEGVFVRYSGEPCEKGEANCKHNGVGFLIPQRKDAPFTYDAYIEGDTSAIQSPDLEKFNGTN